jgi:hypothetical protein
MELPELELLPVCAAICRANSNATAKTNSEYFRMLRFSSALRFGNACGMLLASFGLSPVDSGYQSRSAILLAF